MDCTSVLVSTRILLFKQKTAYGMRISDWSSDVCSSDLGSCTAGKREDFDQYHAVLSWALEHNMRIPPSVKLYLQYGTTAVRDYCMAKGYDRVFDRVGRRCFSLLAVLAPIAARVRLIAPTR